MALAIDLNSAVFNGHATKADETQRIGVRFAFGGMDAGGEGLRSIVVENRNLTLHDDGAVVVLIINKVNGAAADSRAAF